MFMAQDWVLGVHRSAKLLNSNNLNKMWLYSSSIYSIHAIFLKSSTQPCLAPVRPVILLFCAITKSPRSNSVFFCYQKAISLCCTEPIWFRMVKLRNHDTLQNFVYIRNFRRKILSSKQLF